MIKTFRICTIILIFMSTLFISSYKSTANQGFFNMSYLYFGGIHTYVDQVNKTKGSLNVVSPNYFDINDEGKLVITAKLSTPFINEMHRRGVKVVPFLANHWSLKAGRAGLDNRDQLARDIAKAVDQYNLDGVNVDIEGVGRDFQGISYRDLHTDFIRLLRQYLPNGKEISVAVAANPNGWNTGWHGFYDYKGISNHADYLMIMAYDESWESADSPIGPVSSLSFFERSVQYAINQGVPRNKIVNGLPFYGRIWKLDGPTLNNVSIHGRGLSSTRVDPLLKQFNGKVFYDEKVQSPYARFTIPKGKNAFLGLLELTEGDYIIWYENERSIKAKLRVPSRFNIKGTGSWALFHETPETWDYYSLWLNGKYFADVPNGHWGEANIISVAERGWMGGTSSNTFSPNDSLTRAQGAVILIRALGYADRFPKEYIFTDTNGHWARREIELARELGMINGLGNNRFAPNDPLTREQLATILNNIFQFQTEATVSSIKSPFEDVSTDRWSYTPVINIYNKGYLSGFDDGTFRPSAKSTRAQMAALMDRMSLEFEQLKQR
ncbi:glycosyl hydrolase family 18 protein [Anaerobacillus sp. MEB173]|uniref:glycosyl hydrolase family 18 protein n=1 Tax=Anaerobacillus sp. MEB173 TaxID=3383345 RepID=UPI003F8E0090